MRRSRSVALVSALTLAAALAVLTPGGSQAAPSASAGGDRPDRDGPGDRAAAAATRAQLGLSADEWLIPKYVVRDRDGTVHTRYDRTYHGLPVIGGDLVVHRSPRGTIQVDWASRADLTAVGDTTPDVSKASAASVARRSTGLPSAVDDARLVVYAVGNQARLAWESKA